MLSEAVGRAISIAVVVLWLTVCFGMAWGLHAVFVHLDRQLNEENTRAFHNGPPQYIYSPKEVPHADGAGDGADALAGLGG